MIIAITLVMLDSGVSAPAPTQLGTCFCGDSEPFFCLKAFWIAAHERSLPEGNWMIDDVLCVCFLCVVYEFGGVVRHYQ